MLKISNLSASIGDKQILDNVNIELAQGRCLLVTGQNGAGKSTLLHAIMGRPDITTTGNINLDSIELHNIECHERARSGVFLAHQAPPTIDGVNTMTLFKEVQKAQDLDITTGNLIKQLKKQGIFIEETRKNIKGQEPRLVKIKTMKKIDATISQVKYHEEHF
mgnify:CR=1 FL=1